MQKVLALVFLVAAVTISSAQTVMPHVEIAAMPAYPLLPSGGREQGEVQVDISIKRSGEVDNAKAVAGPERLRAVAEKAALQWRFSRGDRQIEKVRLVFAFVLKPGVGEPPAVAASFKPPNRIELYAEPKEIITIRDPAIDIGEPKRK